jgi:hypothetical protein
MRKLLIISVLFLLIFTACQQAPVMQKDEIPACFEARDCDYRNQKDPSKCADDHKECRAVRRYKYCKDPDNRWKDCKEQECWDKLNSK